MGKFLIESYTFINTYIYYIFTFPENLSLLCKDGNWEQRYAKANEKKKIDRSILSSDSEITDLTELFKDCKRLVAQI